MSPSTRCADGPRRAEKRASRRVRTAYLCAPFGPEWAFGIPTGPGPQTYAAQQGTTGGRGCPAPHIYAVLTDTPDASARPSSVSRDHLALRSCGHGERRIATGACGAGGHRGRPCGPHRLRGQGIARRCRRGSSRTDSRPAPVRRGVWPASRVAVVRFARLLSPRASHPHHLTSRRAGPEKSLNGPAARFPTRACICVRRSPRPRLELGGRLSSRGGTMRGGDEPLGSSRRLAVVPLFFHEHPPRRAAPTARLELATSGFGDQCSTC